MKIVDVYLARRFSSGNCESVKYRLRISQQRLPRAPRVVEVALAMQQNIDSILDAAEQREASDVFLQEEEVPRLKINEQIIVFGEEPMSLAHMTAFWQACGANAQGDGDRDRDTGFVRRRMSFLSVRSAITRRR